MDETIEELEKQFLVVECFAKHSLRKDSLIGVAKVSLLLLTAGPVSHKLRLRAVRLPPLRPHHNTVPRASCISVRGESHRAVLAL